MAKGAVELVIGAEFLCEVPPELGRITKLEERDGRLVAITESGAHFICPTCYAEESHSQNK